MCSVQMREDFVHFITSEDYGQTRRLLCAFDSFQPADFLFKNLFVKKQQCAQGLILSGSRDPAVARQISKKLGHFSFRPVAGMPFLVKQNEASDPIDITLFSPNTEMLASDDIANLVGQFRFVVSRRLG